MFFRTALRPLPRFQALPQRFVPNKHRSLVSSVLLTRSWEDESVAALRNEARSRGLSCKGNKPTLITRIQEHEKHTTLQAIGRQDPPLSIHARTTSTASISPGIPPPVLSTSTLPEKVFHINLPDITHDDPEPEVQVPYVPDFWDSKPVKMPQSADPPLPKLVLVAGADTHHGGGPSYNLHDEHGHSTYLTDSHIVPHPIPDPPTTGGFFHDVAQDIGLFDLKEVGKAISELPWKITMNDRQHFGQSRKPLDEDEVKGVWVLLGLVAGSYVIAGIVNTKPDSSNEKNA